MERLSFVHMAAYTGQKQYVLQETLKSPELLNGNRELHILWSAAAGDRKDLVMALLESGASPTDYINRYSFQRIEKNQTRAFPIWLISAANIVERSLFLRSIPDISFEILELFLDCEGVDASDCWFLVKPFGDYDDLWGDQSIHPASHFITLKQFVQDSPPNVERLLALLNRRSGNSYFNGTRYFLSRFNPFFKDTESVMDKETSGYIRFHASDCTDRMRLTSIICGDLRMGVPSFRIY